MADPTTDPAASGTQQESAPTPPAPAGTSYSKDELTAKIKRETAPLLAERDELRAKLAAVEEEKKQAEEAKLSATQRAELERKREREKIDAELKSARDLASTERAKRHDAMRGHRAASLVSTIAAKLFNPTLAPHVEAIVRERLVIEDDGAGGERIAIRLGAPGDTEPVEAGWQKFVDSDLAPFFAAQGGAGAKHGTGAPVNAQTLANLPPSERIKQGLAGQKR